MRLSPTAAPVGLALSADGARLYLTSQVAPPMLGWTSNCPSEQGAGAMHPEGLLAVVDVARAATAPAQAAVAYAPAGCNPVRLDLTPDGRSVWVTARGSGEALRFDLAALGPHGEGRPLRVKVGTSPVGVAVRPDGAQVWVADSDRFSAGRASLALVAPAQGDSPRLAGTLKVGAFPRDLVFLPDGRTLVAALYGAQAVLLHPTSDNLAASR
jgi:DNA-binding beta-propeller fold protein YncE